MRKDYRQIQWDESVEDDLRQLVRLAVREDLDRRFDWTTLAMAPPEAQGAAAFVAREAGVVAGLAACRVALDEMNLKLEFSQRRSDGDSIEPGDCVAEVAGAARHILTSERLLLNLLGRLSGVASQTQQFVQAVSSTSARIYDTRKTTPGWRKLEKHAVRCGGGHNHRLGLFDGVLIKDNHLALASGEENTSLSPGAAVRKARQFLSEMAREAPEAPALLVEVEVDTLEQLSDALSAAPDIVLLDNMTLDEMRAAVEMRDEAAPDTELEASGGVSLKTVAEIADTGVDRISAGALTHAAVWLDIGLDWRS